MKLSERIKNSRTVLLDEWSMDELSRDVAKLENELASAKADGIANILKGDMTPEQYHKLASSSFGLEQQAKGVDEVLACRELDGLSQGEILTIMLIAERLRKQANGVSK